MVHAMLRPSAPLRAGLRFLTVTALFALAQSVTDSPDPRSFFADLTYSARLSDPLLPFPNPWSLAYGVIVAVFPLFGTGQELSSHYPRQN